MSKPDAIWSPDHIRHYISPTGGLNLITESQVTNAQSTVETNGSPCRYIRATAACTIVIKTDRNEVCDCVFLTGETRFVRAIFIFTADQGAQTTQRGASVATTGTDFEVMW